MCLGYLGLDEPADVSVAPRALGQQAEHRCQPLLIVGALLRTQHSTPTLYTTHNGTALTLGEKYIERMNGLI